MAASNGRLYGASSPVGAFRTMEVPSNANSRIRGSIVLEPGGSGALTAIGVSISPPGSNPTGSGFIGIGFDAAGRVVTYRGSAAGGTGITVLSAAACPEGWYWVTVTTDAVGLMLTMISSNGGLEWRLAIKRAELGGDIHNVAVWNSDPRGLYGSSIGPVGYRLDAMPITVGVGIEDRAPSSLWGWGPISGAAQHVALPKAYDGSELLPLVLYAHGSSGTENSVLERDTVNVYTELLDAGYAVASSSQHGNNWGNQQSVDDLIATYNYVNARWPVSKAFVLGHSMGGASSLQVAVSGLIPVAAWAGIYPVTNLRQMWDMGRYQAAIAAAYGATAQTFDQLVKPHSPLAMDASNFDGLPMRFYASHNDDVVSRYANSELMFDHVQGHAAEATVVEHVGQHGDPTAFKTRDLVDFFNTYR